MSPAERMAALFPGNPRAHYVANLSKTVTKRRQDGTVKIIPAPYTDEKGVRRPGYHSKVGLATVADFEAHLEGKMALLDIPVDDNGRTRCGIIDLDEYQKYSATQIVHLILSNSLPLIPTWTKSGGWHLAWHFRQAKIAVDVIAQLHLWAKLLGFKNYEVFPKQEELEPDAVGSGINLPYFGGDADSTKNFAVNAKGERMTVEAWLTVVETTPEWVPFDTAPDAAVDLVVKHWVNGQQHYLGMAVTGFLLKRGRKDPAYCDALLDAVCARTGTTNDTIFPAKILRDLEADKRVPGFPKLCTLMGEEDATALAAAFGIVVTAEPVVEREPIELRGSSIEELRAPLRDEKYLVEGMVPTEAYTLIAGALSSYKTMLMLNLLIWRATGHNLLALPEIDDPVEGSACGPSVLLTYEDTDWRIVERIKRLAQHGYQLLRKRHGVASAEKFLADITQNLRRIPLSGKFGKTLISRPKGEVVPNMAFVEELLEGVRTFASEGVLIGLDPLRLALVGSQNDDDGADVAVNVLNYIASSLPNSGLVVCSHTTKSGAKEPGIGYADASYSTSGSALYSQHARSNFLLARLSAEDIQRQFDLRALSPDDVQQQRVARLTHGRLSHGVESTDQYVRMRDGVLLPIEPMRGRTAADDMDYAMPAVAEAIERLVQAEVTVSQNALTRDTQLKALIGGEKKIRDVLKMLEEQQFIEYAGAGRTKVGALTEKGRNRVAMLKQMQADRCHALPQLGGSGS